MPAGREALSRHLLRLLDDLQETIWDVDSAAAASAATLDAAKEQRRIAMERLRDAIDAEWHL